MLKFLNFWSLSRGELKKLKILCIFLDVNMGNLV
jgi:hypothetical protein